MRAIVRRLTAIICAAGLGAAITAPTASHAQATDQPSQRISFVVGFAVGGFADTMARWFATRLGERTGQSVVVQNMEGGGGIRAARRVATAPPDGYTILVTTTSLAVNETLVPSRGYAATSLEAISLPVSAPESLSVSAKSPIKSLAELVNDAKAGKVFMGSAGIGSGSHIAGEYFFKVIAKTPVKHIPFQGGNPAMMGLLTGDVTALAATATALVRNVKNGDVTGLGIAATERSPMLMLVIAPEVPAKTLAEFVAYAKANPGKLNFGFGQGTLPQLVGEMFKRATGAEIANIPYKGGVNAVTDMLGGRVQMNIGTISTLAPLVREGKLRALAVTSAARNPELPDVPTMAEGGLPEVASMTYYGFFAPSGTPADAIRRINVAVNESIKAPDIAAAIRRIGFEPHGGTPEDFASLIASEMKVWVPIVQATGFQMN